mmetsp:Transcript_16425/g.22524  ORF Transcript_16425/g.22524 Transcript_16425/m.22524 type:complete len:226 (-) Transcript_16425:307-984(-)
MADPAPTQEEVSTPPDAAPATDATEAGAEDSAPASEEVKLVVKNLSYDTTEQTIRDQFGAHGTLTDVYLPTDRYSGRPRGFGFVTMSTKAEAEAAISALDQTELDGRTIKVAESRPRGERESYGGGGGGYGGGGGGGGNMKLYVGNLSYSTEEEGVRSLFESVGTVSDCYLPTERDTGRPRGFAFVTMPRNDANAAIEQFQGYELDGRNIRVNEAQQKGRGGRRY